MTYLSIVCYEMFRIAKIRIIQICLRKKLVYRPFFIIKDR